MKKKLSVPPLTPIYGTVLDCSASYIKEEYIDLDQYVKNYDEPIINYSDIKLKKMKKFSIQL